MDNNPLKNLWQVTDLRNRVLFTLAMLGVYRVGNHIPTPGVVMALPTRYAASRPSV